MIFISIVVGIFMVASLAWMGRVVYLAFVKKKDAQEKLILTKAMAQSFVIVLIINVIHLIVSFLEAFDVLIPHLFEGLDIHPSMLYVIILGVVMLLNKKLNRKLGM